MNFLVLILLLFDSESGVCRNKTQYSMNCWSGEMQQSLAKSRPAQG